MSKMTEAKKRRSDAVLSEARKRMFAAAGDKNASHLTFVQAYRRVVKIQEDAVKKENAKIMKAYADAFGT